MGVDYYKLLQVNEDAGEEEIRRAFRRLARIWHPDKNPSARNQPEAMFTQIYEAYNVLVDPLKRAEYDQKPKVKEKELPVGGDGGTEDKDSEFRDGAGSSGWLGSIGAPPQTFGERLVKKIFGDDLEFARFTQAKKADTIETPLPCSLEDLFNGGTKRMKITRMIVDASGKKLPVEEFLTITIAPGCKKGDRFFFPEMGNEELDLIPADLVFIVDEKPHSMFAREEDDLVVTQKITLVEALTGVTVNLKTLDRRQLRITVDDVIRPGYEKVIAGEGMPVAGKDPSRRGDLRIRFDTEFPESLTPEQKATVRRLFAG